VDADVLDLGLVDELRPAGTPRSRQYSIEQRFSEGVLYVAEKVSWYWKLFSVRDYATKDSRLWLCPL
jgi:hypothetical protein